MQNSEFVTLVPERTVVIADAMEYFEFELPTWDFPPFYPQTDSFEEMCLYYLVFNSINYCYFDEYDNRFQDGKNRSSTLAGLRITENWDQLKDPQFLAHVDEVYMLGELFKAEIPISLVKERAAAFREIGEFILQNPDFTFQKMFAKHHRNAYFVSQMIPNYLPSWRDPFFKRAQLFVGMVQGRFQADAPFDKGLKDLTIFADYRVPQTLHDLGIISYRAPMLSILYAGQFIPCGSRMELEIRAASIVGADLLKEALNVYYGGALTSLEMDYFLWGIKRQKDSLPEGVFNNRKVSHHRTMTTDY
jgi:hypothetical protein